MNALAIFGISALMSTIASAIVAILYLWPRLRSLEPKRALAALVAPHMVRFVGLSLLVPGVVSPLLPAPFAVPTAYGDFIACVLAIIATIALLKGAPWAIPAAWVFNLWGTADFLLAFYNGPHSGLQPGALGAAFYIVTAIVPALLVSHVLIFRLMVRPELRKPA